MNLSSSSVHKSSETPRKFFKSDDGECQFSHLHKDTTYTKIFVGGLPYHTTDETLRAYFEYFGELEETVVITDRQTGKSRGYGFVTMKHSEDAMKAIEDPNPCIDGRKTNVNLAILGAKPRNVPTMASVLENRIDQTNRVNFILTSNYSNPLLNILFPTAQTNTLLQPVLSPTPFSNPILNPVINMPLISQTNNCFSHISRNLPIDQYLSYNLPFPSCQKVPQTSPVIINANEKILLKSELYNPQNILFKQLYSTGGMHLN